MHYNEIIVRGMKAVRKHFPEQKKVITKENLVVHKVDGQLSVAVYAVSVCMC